MADLFESMGKHRAAVIRLLLESPDYRRVLDIGSGGLHGWYGHDERIVRLDIDPKTEADMRGTVDALPIRSGACDLVIATELIEHIRYPLRMLAEICRVLKERGHLLISTPNPSHMESRLAMLLLGYFLPDRHDHGEGDVGHIHFIDPQFLTRLLEKSGFELMRDFSDILHLGRFLWVHVPRFIPSSLRSQTMYLARKHRTEAGEA